MAVASEATAATAATTVASASLSSMRTKLVSRPGNDLSMVTPRPNSTSRCWSRVGLSWLFDLLIKLFGNVVLIFLGPGGLIYFFLKTLVIGEIGVGFWFCATRVATRKEERQKCNNVCFFDNYLV